MGKAWPILLLAVAAGLTAVAILGGGSDETGLDGPRPGRAAADDGATLPRPEPPAADADATAEAPLPGAPAEGKAAIDGKALRSDGIAARGAVVSVHDLPTEPGVLPEARVRALVGDEGFFRFDGVPPGSYLVRATLDGFAPAGDVVRGLAAGEIRTVSLRLSPARRIAGRVVDENGDPVAGARVTAGPGAIPAAAARSPAFADLVLPAAVHAVADVDGSFAVEGLPRGLFDVTATAKGFLPGVSPGIRPTDEAVFLVLRPTWDVVVHLTWEGERPEAPEVVAADGTTATRTGGEEEEILFRLPLDEGTHRVVARAAGFASAAADVTTGPGVEFPELALRLGAGTVVSGRVLDEVSGDPIPEATVAFLARPDGGDRGDAEERLRVRSGTDGRYEARLGPGYWVAKAEAEGWLPPEKEARPLRVGNAPVERDLHLRPEYAAVGRVVWRDGLPADERVVCWSPGPHGLRAVRCGEDGRYRIVGLKPGIRYEVRARAGKSEEVRPGVVLPAGARIVEVPEMVLDEPPAPDPNEALSNATLRGRVVGEGGEPIAGASVAGLGASATTNATGAFELVGPAPPPPEYAAAVHVLAPARPPVRSDTFRCPPGSVTDVGEVFVPAEGVWIHGRVTDAKRDPVPGAVVTAAFGLVGITVRANKAGEFRIEGPAPPPTGAPVVRVTALAPGFVPRTLAKEAIPGVWFELVLLPPAAVTGKLVFSGDPPPFVDLVCGRWPLFRRPLEIDEEGRFRVELTAGTSLSRIDASGFLPYDLARNAYVGAGQTLDLGEVPLSRGGTVVVRLVDHAGRPIVGETAEIRGPRRYDKSVSDATGEVRFATLPPGSYTIRGRPDWNAVTENVEIEGEETKRIDLALP